MSKHMREVRERMPKRPGDEAFLQALDRGDRVLGSGYLRRRGGWVAMGSWVEAHWTSARAVGILEKRGARWEQN